MINFLATFLHNPWLLLAGLLTLAIPIIIHLLNRRRFQVVDWGAMQFLQISEATRRRILIEELLLMLLRMGLLLALVVAFAGLFFDTKLDLTPAILGILGLFPLLLLAVGAIASIAGQRKRPGLIVFGLVGILALGFLYLVHRQQPGGIARLGSGNRDVVLILDGSASMLAAGEGEKAPAELAKAFALDFLKDLVPGDSVAVIVAREQPVMLVGELSVDHARARKKLDALPEPAGSANWPEAVRAAVAILASSQKADREIILVGDNQKFGWADSDTLFRWELIASEMSGSEKIKPRLWAVNLAKDRPARLPNWSLSAIASNRPVVPVDREVGFKTDILLYGQKSYSPPYRIRLEVDGKHVRDLPPPGGKVGASLPVPQDGKVPFSFTHRFASAGSHLVSVILEPDPPEDARPRGYEVKDRVPGDNRQDFAIEVLEALPVLIVDGENSAVPPQQRNTDFLRDALSPARDRNPVVKTRVIGLPEFTPELLTADPRPRVLILHDVARLSAVQTEAIGAYLGEGGGVLVTLGARAETDWYNQNLYRAGEGFLPAQLDSLDGDEKKPVEAMSPDPVTFTHPATELFRGIPVGGLGEAKFYRWWKLAIPGKSAPGLVAGTMRNATVRTPLLIERTFAAGRVMLSAVPLDNAWGTNLTDLPSFVPLVHELVYYLAGARSADFNLRAGQPIRYRAAGKRTLDEFALQLPVGESQRLSNIAGEPDTYPAQLFSRERDSLLVYEGTREAGVYRLTTPAQETVYYVIPADGRESDLSSCDEEDRKKVSDLVGVQYATDRADVLRGFTEGVQRQELWWFLLVGLIGLLCLEVFMTRAMAMNR